MEMLERIKMENDKLREMVKAATLSLTNEERETVLRTADAGDAFVRKAISNMASCHDDRFCVIMELTEEEKRELLSMWKERNKG